MAKNDEDATVVESGQRHERVPRAPRAGSSAQRAGGSGASNLFVSFAELERLSAGVRAHTEFVRTRLPGVARVAIDGDLAASAVLSPGTFAAAESAVLGASARMAQHLVFAEGLVIVSSTIATTYQLADAALAVGAAQLRVAGGLAGGSVLLGTSVILVKTAVHALVAGFADELGESLIEGLQKAVQAYIENPLLVVTGVPVFASHVVHQAAQSFSTDDVLTRSVSHFQRFVGTTGPLYDDILELLIRSGQRLGWFHDGEVLLGESEVDPAKRHERAEKAAEMSWKAIHGESEPGWEQIDDKIVPRDFTSLWAGAGQIDNIGKKDMAVIRITEVVDVAGTRRFIVQIPSTQSWMPFGSDIPNDIASDLRALAMRDETALAKAVIKAMEAAGIGDAPVMLAGFSLGGITAASIAAGNSGFNIEHVVTAGSPIGRMPIPSSVSVTSFEAEKDIVARLEGASNPTATNWTTITQPAPLLHGPSDDSPLGTVFGHDAIRYALMAHSTPALDNADAMTPFFEGTATVTDYYAKEPRNE